MADEPVENVPTDSILNTTKKILNVPIEMNDYDLDIITHINTTFSILAQMGVGPAQSLYISDASTPWSSFIAGNVDMNMVRTYMALKVRSVFDLLPTSFQGDATKEVINELEWRLHVQGQEVSP